MTKLRAGVAVSVVCAGLFTARVASAESPPREPKDRATAFGLSAGGTLLSIGLTAAGLGAQSGEFAAAGVLSSFVLPSAGEFYAGKVLTWGMGIRAVSAAAVVMGFDEAFKCWGGNSPTCHSDKNEAENLLIIGAVGYATGIIYDIATAGSAADEYNKKHQLQLSPVVVRTANAGQAYGVGLSGRF